MTMDVDVNVDVNVDRNVDVGKVCVRAPGAWGTWCPDRCKIGV